MTRTVTIQKQGENLEQAAEFLRQYYVNNSPLLTGALRRSWRTNIGRQVAVVFSPLPYSYRIRRRYNRRMTDVLNNGIRATRRRYAGLTFSTQQSNGRLQVTIRTR